MSPSEIKFTTAPEKDAATKGKTPIVIPGAAITDPKAARRAAAELQANLNKQYGPGTVISMGDRVGMKYDVTPTGIYTLDNYAIQAGGVPKGRVIEVFGPASSGKTTLTLQIVAQAQKAGGLAAFIDAEHALDPRWASIQGVNVDDLLINQPDNGEQALEIALAFVESGAFAVIVIDSVAALVPKAELDGEMGDSHVGLQARLMSQALRKLTGAVAKSKTTVIFINQIREKIGISFGSNETTSGGRALMFYASVRIDVRRVAQVKDGDNNIGNKTKFKIVKNKVGAPFRETEVDLLFASGYDIYSNLLDAAEANGTVDKAGAWYSLDGERLGNGRSNVSASLRNDPVLYKRIYAATVATDEKKAAAAKVKKEAEL